MFYNKQTQEPRVGRIILAIVLALIAIVLINMAVMPNYRIYKQNKQGEANLRQQEWEKKIAVEEARAVLESSSLKAQAEVERAKGVAEANAIIADSLKGNEAYLKYLWIDKMSDNPNVIYVPTEASLPILEARNK